LIFLCLVSYARVCASALLLGTDVTYTIDSIDKYTLWNTYRVRSRYLRYKRKRYQNCSWSQ